MENQGKSRLVKIKRIANDIKVHTLYDPTTNEVELPQTRKCRHDDSFFSNNQCHRRKGMESYSESIV
jgi:hypothetical protein